MTRPGKLLAIPAFALVLGGCLHVQVNDPIVKQFQVAGKTQTIVSVTAQNAPTGNSATGMFLFDETGKLEWANAVQNAGLLESSLPQTLLNGLGEAASAVTAIYGIK
jgi:hypothetical protein